MKKRTQFSVMVPNEPGQLEKATAALAKGGVNLSGVTSINLGRSACLKFLGEPAETLARELAAAGLKTCESLVFELQVSESASELNRLFCLIAENGINILSCYGNSAGGAMRLIVAVDRPEAAAALLDEAAAESGVLCMAR